MNMHHRSSQSVKLVSVSEWLCVSHTNNNTNSVEQLSHRSPSWAQGASSCKCSSKNFSKIRNGLMQLVWDSLHHAKIISLFVWTSIQPHGDLHQYSLSCALFYTMLWCSVFFCMSLLFCRQNCQIGLDLDLVTNESCQTICRKEKQVFPLNTNWRWGIVPSKIAACLAAAVSSFLQTSTSILDHIFWYKLLFPCLRLVGW